MGSITVAALHAKWSLLTSCSGSSSEIPSFTPIQCCPSYFFCLRPPTAWASLQRVHPPSLLCPTFLLFLLYLLCPLWPPHCPQRILPLTLLMWTRNHPRSRSPR